MTVPLVFSVVVCTHNRADYLERALAGLAQQDLDPERFEVLIVDNASTDDTKQRTSRFQNGVLTVRYIYEPKIGLSVARNTGWREAVGQYIAYLDDDAIPSTGWLRAAAEVFAADEGKIGILGGRVDPIWEAPRPNWLSDSLLGYLSMIDLGPSPRFVDEDKGIVGANMIIPRHLLEQVGGFSPLVGRIGGSLLSGEEFLLKRTLAAAGYRGFYHPEVRVQHHASAERLTRDWFFRRLYWQGRTNAELFFVDRSLPVFQRVIRASLAMGKAGMLYVSSLLARQRFDWRARAIGHYGLAMGLFMRKED